MSLHSSSAVPLCSITIVYLSRFTCGISVLLCGLKVHSSSLDQHSEARLMQRFFHFLLTCNPQPYYYLIVFPSLFQCVIFPLHVCWKACIPLAWLCNSAAVFQLHMRAPYWWSGVRRAPNINTRRASLDIRLCYCWADKTVAALSWFSWKTIFSGWHNQSFCMWQRSFTFDLSNGSHSRDLQHSKRGI